MTDSDKFFCLEAADSAYLGQLKICVKESRDQHRKQVFPPPQHTHREGAGLDCGPRLYLPVVCWPGRQQVHGDSQHTPFLGSFRKPLVRQEPSTTQSLEGPTGSGKTHKATPSFKDLCFFP